MSINDLQDHVYLYRILDMSIRCVSIQNEMNVPLERRRKLFLSNIKETILELNSNKFDK